MRKHHTPEQWKNLVDQQFDSGLSAVQSNHHSLTDAVRAVCTNSKRYSV